MRNKNLFYIIVVVTLFSLSFLGMMEAQAGSKDLVATKRTKFKDNDVESMRDVFDVRDKKEDQYRQKMLSNSEQTIQLLTEVRDLLIRLNAKKI